MSIRMEHSAFIHIPRTGGLWMHEVVRRLEIKHFVLRGDIDGHMPFLDLPRVWRNLEAFSFIRHPLSWVKSRWSHVLEHNLAKDYRHYGIHRLFDKCVQPTLEGTIKTIMGKEPGLVGRTFHEMLMGVRHVGLTEDLPLSAWYFLHGLEQVSDDHKQLVLGVSPTNSTTTMDKYSKELSNLPDSLEDEFLDSERKALVWWLNLRKKFIFLHSK